MHVPESPVFTGIEPLDLSWFERGDGRLPIACTGVFRIATGRADTVGLAWQCDLHAYLKNASEINAVSGSPLVEIRAGKGILIASEMNYESARIDPIAERLLNNLIHYLAGH
jgi:hypothetical protein